MKPAKKIALIGFDAAMTHLVQQHIDEGLCPNFKKVFEGGTVATNCLVPYPTITPPNWTVMATGAWPGTNGITDFFRHLPGTTPDTQNTHSVFNWEHVQSESIWEAAERVGKKSVLLNFPMGYNAHKRLKNSIVVGGSSPMMGMFMDTEFVGRLKGSNKDQHNMSQYASLCAEFLVSTEAFPGHTARIKFDKAQDWKNVPNMGSDPLEAWFMMPFPDSIFDVVPAKWHILVRDMQGNGYDTLTMAPEKDFAKAFFTVKPGEWSPCFDAMAPLKDGSQKEVRLKCQLVSMSDEADNLRLYFTAGLNTDGELWCFPPEKGKSLCQSQGVADAGGMDKMTYGWFGADTFCDGAALQYEWQADAAEALLKDGDWDILYSHIHPTDYYYHYIMTDMDPATCSSKAAHDLAWKMHRKLFVDADRYLGRILSLLDEDTLVCLISDHGATADGPTVNVQKLLEDAGLCSVKETKLDGLDLEGMSGALVDFMISQAIRVDPAKSVAIPQRTCYIYVNLKGRDPEGIVEPEDYPKVQRQIIDALMDYKHPQTGNRPFIMAIPKQEAMMLGLWGEQCGDVVYAYWPEYTMQHGPILPSSEFGIGTIKTLCVFYGPKLGIRQGFKMERVCNLVDLVPTFCYLTGWPIPKTAEGSVIYQIMEDVDFRPPAITK